MNRDVNIFKQYLIERIGEIEAEVPIQNFYQLIGEKNIQVREPSLLTDTEKRLFSKQKEILKMVMF